MMTRLKVALAGATGNLGQHVLNQLLAAGHSVVVLTRKGSRKLTEIKDSLLVTVAEVDLNDSASISPHLLGCKVFISALPSAAAGKQRPLIDAAVHMGLERFIPTEFGSDTLNEKTAALPVYAGKIETQLYLQTITKSNHRFSYTILCNGPFFDWGLQTGMIVNPSAHTASVYDGGDRLASCTTLDGIGRGIVGIISQLDKTKNRAVYIQEVLTTQNKLIDIVRKLDGQDWKITHKETRKLYEESMIEMASANPDIRKAYLGFLPSASYAEGFGGNFSDHLDNDLLCIEQMTEGDLETLIRSYISVSKSK